MTEAHTIELPAKLDRQWALSQGPTLLHSLQSHDLILVGSAVESVDVVAAGTLHRCRQVAKVRERALILRAPSAELLARLDALSSPDRETVAPPERPSTVLALGTWAWKVGNEGREIGLMAREFFIGTVLFLARKERTWPKATWRQLHDLGTTALPVVVLLTGLIGLTLALLMGDQLATYGAAVHLATLMGVAFVREVGPLLTAVILAGRSGSAITAELASMAVQEEIDALQTMGARTSSFLVAPRLVALLIAMPILSLAACAAGILAGLTIATLHLGLDARTFAQFLSEAIEAQDIVTAVLKSMTFALILGFIACRSGLSVRGGSDAVGRATTYTVVAGIFWTIIADCIFALVLYL